MSKNVVSLPMADRHPASVSDSKKSSVSHITRTKQEEFAIRLRDIARRIELGGAQFAAVVFCDERGKTEEYILDKVKS